LWKKYKNYVAVLLITILLTVYTWWYLQLHPEKLSHFLIGPLIALIFVILVALKPEYGKRLSKAIMTYDAKRKELGGRFYRYRIIALVLFFLIVLAFPIVWEYQLVPSQYVAFVVLSFLVVVVALGIIQIVGIIKVAKKWGLLFILILTAIVILRMLIGGMLR